MDGDQLVRDAGAAWLRKGVEVSLEALSTDYIDLYQVHWPDPDTASPQLDETYVSDQSDEIRIELLGPVTAS